MLRVGEWYRWAHRAFRHYGPGGKARHYLTDATQAVQPRFPSEDLSPKRHLNTELTRHRRRNIRSPAATDRTSKGGSTKGPPCPPDCCQPFPSKSNITNQLFFLGGAHQSTHLKSGSNLTEKTSAIQQLLTTKFRRVIHVTKKYMDNNKTRP